MYTKRNNEAKRMIDATRSPKKLIKREREMREKWNDERKPGVCDLSDDQRVEDNCADRVFNN
jgi:hypothetical protein